MGLSLHLPRDSSRAEHRQSRQAPLNRLAIFSAVGATFWWRVLERFVQTAKRALYAIRGDWPTTDETLSIAMEKVEVILNGHVTVDPWDPELLTPFHFLLGRSSPAIPPNVFCEGDAVSGETWHLAPTACGPIRFPQHLFVSPFVFIVKIVYFFYFF